MTDIGHRIFPDRPDCQVSRCEEIMQSDVEMIKRPPSLYVRTAGVTIIVYPLLGLASFIQWNLYSQDTIVYKFRSLSLVERLSFFHRFKAIGKPFLWDLKNRPS